MADCNKGNIWIVFERSFEVQQFCVFLYINKTVEEKGKRTHCSIFSSLQKCCSKRLLCILYERIKQLHLIICISIIMHIFKKKTKSLLFLFIYLIVVWISMDTLFIVQWLQAAASLLCQVWTLPVEPITRDGSR